MRKSQAYYSINDHLKTETNQMLEERQIQMHSKSMHPAMCLKVNLGVVRALKMLRQYIYWPTIIRAKKLSKAAELEPYRDSLKHDHLVISGVL